MREVDNTTPYRKKSSTGRMQTHDLMSFDPQVCALPLCQSAITAAPTG